MDLYLIFINVVFTSVSSFVTWIIKLPSPSNHIQCRDVACGHKISIELSVSISICVSFLMHFQCKFRFISPVIELVAAIYNGRSDYQMTMLNHCRPDSIAIMSFRLHMGELNGALSRSHLFL